MYFSDLIGQTELIDELKKQIISDKVLHAYVFTGKRGIGKKTVARKFAEALMCFEPVNGEKCGKCNSCSLFLNGTNPDFHFIEPGETSIGVDEIRRIQSDILIKPVYSKRKVYIITEADKMTAQAQNCLLKTLEEPPSYAVIILTVSNYHGLLETVRSRTIKTTFKKNTAAEVRQVLNQQFGGNLPGMEFIISYSDGIIGAALEMGGSESFIQIRQKAIEIVDKLSKSGMAYVFEAYEFFEKNKADIELILEIMLLYYRDLLVAKQSGNEKILINSDKKDIILRNGADYTTRGLIEAASTIETALKNIKQNANFQLAIEVMLMKLQEEVLNG